MIYRKHIIKFVGFFFLVGSLLSACNKSNEIVATQYSPYEIAAAMLTYLDNVSALEPLYLEDEYFNEYLSTKYLIESDLVDEGIILYSTGMRAYEIAVLRFAENAAIQDITDSLMSYIQRRSDAFRGYAPGEAAILDNSLVETKGEYMALLICDDVTTAQRIFIECFSDKPPEIDYDKVASVLFPVEIKDDNHETGSETNEPNEVIEAKENTEHNEAQDDAEGTINNDDIVNEKDNGDTESTNDIATETPDHFPNDSTETVTETDDSKAREPSEIETEPGIDVDTDTNIDTDTEESGFEANFEANNEPEIELDPADPNDLYNPDSILQAWHSGDKSGLSPKNRAILDACIEIIGENITVEMSEYDKELFANDWIVNWVSYDEETVSNAPDASPDPNNDNPYGAIFKQLSICSGYTSTFQLFMDMLGIECITINGSYRATGGEHAWNMVRIDGNWYCVDVTWNDPIGGRQTLEMQRRFFNVTTEYMRITGHEWDESTTPVADSGKLYYG